jgi:hypothetical protein
MPQFQEKAEAFLEQIENGKSETLKRRKRKLDYSLPLIIAFHCCRANASLAARQAERLPYNRRRICDPPNRCKVVILESGN